MNPLRNPAWDQDNRDQMKKKLALLDVEHLKLFAKKICADKKPEIDKIEDKDGVTAKEQLMMILNECDYDLLEREFDQSSPPVT